MRYAETGYNLEVDLTRGNIERVATDPEDTELYIVTDDPSEVIDIIEKAEGKKWLEPGGVVTFRENKV